MTPQPPAAEPANTRILKIVGLVLFACVALCGLAGTCLLVITFVLPQGGP